MQGEGRPGIPTLGALRQRVATLLAQASETPRLDADLLLGHALRLTRAQVLARHDQPLAAGEVERVEQLVERRLGGEPVAYITGSKAFRGIELYVDERVLVPRPETETIVDIALWFLRYRGGSRRAVDIGTGSGAIAFSLAVELGERDEVAIVASDISQEALDVAAVNRERLGLDGRVCLVRSDLLDDVSGRFDLILANLPYLRGDQRHPSTAREPQGALYAGEDGLDAYRRLMPQVGERLDPKGVLICEIDSSQADAVLELAESLAELPAVIMVDLAGRARFLLAGAVGHHRFVGPKWYPDPPSYRGD